MCVSVCVGVSVCEHACLLVRQPTYQHLALRLWPHPDLWANAVLLHPNLEEIWAVEGLPDRLIMWRGIVFHFPSMAARQEVRHIVLLLREENTVLTTIIP